MFGKTPTWFIIHNPVLAEATFYCNTATRQNAELGRRLQKLIRHRIQTLSP